jgi:PIN domain nuclease of toxin-antitoxin system
MGGPARLKLLLDTHIWLWGQWEPNRLGPKTLRELRDSTNEIWLSPISTWEALLLHTKGKIHLSVDLAEWLTESTAGTREAPLTHEIALAAQQLPLHQDPADRFLAATAQVLDLVLVTADERLLGLGNIKTMANR